MAHPSRLIGGWLAIWTGMKAYLYPYPPPCTRYVYYAYLCFMERQERIERFEKGESIYSIAKAADVSRQSMMRCLKRAGVYTPGDRLGTDLTFTKTTETSMTGKSSMYELDEMGKMGSGDVEKRWDVAKNAVQSPANCPIDSVPEVDLSTIKGKKRIGRNLYATPKGYVVFDLKHGGDKLYGSREEVLSAYNLSK